MEGRREWAAAKPTEEAVRARRPLERAEWAEQAAVAHQTDAILAAEAGDADTAENHRRLAELYDEAARIHRAIDRLTAATVDPDR